MGRAWTLTLLAATAAGCTDSVEDPCSVGGNVCELAGNGEAAFTGDGKAAIETSFYLPSVGRRGPDELLYVMDLNNMRLRRVEVDGTVSTVAGNGFHSGATTGAPARESSLESPVDVDFMLDGQPIFVSSHDPRVFSVDSAGMLQLVAGEGIVGALGNEGDGGSALNARFIEPSAVAIAGDGTIYISDRTANRIRKISDGIITTLYGTRATSYLNEPEGLAVDAEGNVFVADSGNNVVRKIAVDGSVSIVAGNLVKGFSGDGGLATDAQLSTPTGVTVAEDGTLYIADRFNRRVRRVTPDGIIETIAGTGAPGPSGNGGPALLAEFGYVSRVQLDSDGGLIVADQSNNCVRKIVAPF